MSTFIRDNMGRLKGQRIENGNVSHLRDEKGKLKGQYIKSSDKTYDGQGHYVGPGDQTLRTGQVRRRLRNRLLRTRLSGGVGGQD
ncbi:MAG: hypothetical protein WCT12_26465 [Verrucomicrobiota bacterium]|jgi:hypothetical protein